MNAFLNLDNYNIVCRKDRVDTQKGIGGGLLVYAKTNMVCKEMTGDYLDSFNQCCGLSIKTGTNGFLNIVLVYRPHNLYNDNNVTDNNNQMCQMLRSLPKDCIIVGDFNFSEIDWELNTCAARSRGFLDTINDLFFTQMLTFPTHKSGTMPDLVITDRPNIIIDIDSLGPLGSSDHTMIKVNLKLNPVRTKKSVRVRDWRKANFQMLKENVENVQWEDLLAGKGAQQAWDTFLHRLEEEVERAVPWRTVRSSNKPLWMRANCLRLIRKKRKLWKEYTRCKEYQSFKAYKDVESKVKKAVHRAKKDLEKKLALDAKKNPKAFYRYINSKKCNRESVGPLKVNDSVVDDDQGIADALNEFFSSVFTKEDMSNIPRLNNIKDDIEPLRSLQITRTKVKTKLDKLKPLSAPGPDGVPPCVLIELADELSVPLALIFNLSLSTGVIPEVWKQANVTPIYKKGPKTSPGNYRPVSLTSIICKVMESLLRDEIVRHLAVNNLIYPSQHGFMAKRSCLTNLLEYLELLSDLVDQGHAVDVVYLDFAKAFDKVPHARLSAVLTAHGIGGELLSWVEEWLRGRTQRVVLNGKESNWLPVTSGVPQGSVLGPTLFVVFINTIDEALEGLSGFVSKFADDTKVGRVVDTAADGEALQNIINHLVDWADKWQMQFNSDKCKVIHFGRINPRNVYTMGGHAPAGVVLEGVKAEKDVGVMVSDDLKPSLQCSTAAKKANAILGRMARSFTYRDRNVWLRLYKTYIRPHLEYAAQAWSPWTQQDIRVLEDVQQRAVRMISGLHSQTYQDRLLELGMTTLEERRVRGDMLQTWKILHGHDNVKEGTWFSRLSATAVRETRASSAPYTLEQRRVNTDLRRQMFGYRVVRRWNNLPLHIRDATSVNDFKSKYDMWVKAAGTGDQSAASAH